MTGTFPYCRTHQAITWLEDGDTIQNLETEYYFKKENDVILFSTDNNHWQEFTKPMEIFPSFVEWRSTSNLHYLEDLDISLKPKNLKYLTMDDRMLDRDDPEADKTKKRWFVGGVL